MARSMYPPRYRLTLFFFGFFLFIMGAIPLIALTIPAADAFIKSLAPISGMVYQVLLVLLGIAAMSYSMRRPGFPGMPFGY